jgi:hypothetical protein
MVYRVLEKHTQVTKVVIGENMDDRNEGILHLISICDPSLVFGPDAIDAPEAWFKHAEPQPLWVSMTLLATTKHMALISYVTCLASSLIA